MEFAVYSADNPVFAAFSFYAALLAAKMLAMAFLTGRQRMSKRAFANPEDAALTPGGKVKQDDDVERIRRAHLNDIENIVPFFIIGLIYVGTGPSLSWAKLLFRIFTFARFLHTLVYAVFVIPQPSRAIAFIAGMLVNFYMIFAILSYYLHAYFFAALVLGKLLVMSFLTSIQRMKKKAFANPEDTPLRPGGKVKVDDDVERIRRAHLNDTENIIPFLILGLLYVGTGPSPAWAIILFLLFTIARFVHTLVYAIYIISQPARAIAFGVGMLINVYMIFAILLHYQAAL